MAAIINSQNTIILLAFIPLLFLGCATTKKNANAISNTETVVVKPFPSEKVAGSEYREKLLFIKQCIESHHATDCKYNLLCFKVDSLLEKDSEKRIKVVKDGVKYGFLSGLVGGAIISIWAYNQEPGDPAFNKSPLFLLILTADISLKTTAVGLGYAGLYTGIRKMKGGRIISDSEKRYLDEIILQYNGLKSTSD